MPASHLPLRKRETHPSRRNGYRAAPVILLNAVPTEGDPMRLLAVMGAAALMVSGGLGLDSAAASLPASTQLIVVRPVTSTGHIASGFTLQGEPKGAVDCSSKSPSPGAIDKNIELCSPSSEYAIACWNAALAHHVLCMRQLRTKNVVRIPRTGAFANTPIAPPSLRAPLTIKLADGDICTIRDGGAWSQLPGHPHLFGTYGCLHAGAVWASLTQQHFGIDMSHPLWTVRTAHFGGSVLTTHHVVKAWFVGTKSV